MKLTMGRVLVLMHTALVIVAALAVFVAGITGSLPAAWQADAAIVLAILGGLATSLGATIKFLDGSQKWDALQSGQPPVLLPTAWPNVAPPVNPPTLPPAPHPQP